LPKDAVPTDRTRLGPTCRTLAWEVCGDVGHAGEDTLATEEPMEIRLVVGAARYPVAVTMRTPGEDFELAAGFLFNEGILRRGEQIRRMSYCGDRGVDNPQHHNIVNVEVTGVRVDDIAPLERHFTMTSACGVCGKATLDALRQRGCEAVGEGPPLAAQVLGSLPSKLRDGQKLFQTTGGLHAAGLFSPSGDLVSLREDVGRHNAMDKLAGWAVMNGRLPLGGHVLLVSGRSSFELVQKALCIGVVALCSVSAPSSLAVDVAREFGLTLVGFLRDGRFKIYSGAQRVQFS
jgi:FdhD protein